MSCARGPNFYRTITETVGQDHDLTVLDTLSGEIRARAGDGGSGPCLPGPVPDSGRPNCAQASAWMAASCLRKGLPRSASASGRYWQLACLEREAPDARAGASGRGLSRRLVRAQASACASLVSARDRTADLPRRRGCHYNAPSEYLC